MLFALIVFVVLLVAGLVLGELSWRQVGGFAAVVGAPFVLHYLSLPFLIYFGVLAVLDVTLVLMIFKGDIRVR